VSSGGAEQTIFHEDCDEETSLDDWTLVNYVNYYPYPPAIGTAMVHMGYTSSMERTISTVGYDTITVSAYMGTSYLNAGENLQFLWYDGSTWTLLKQIDEGDPEDDGDIYYFEYSLPASANDNPNFALKFQLNADYWDDYGWIDEIVVKGYQ
jgi:hypothetical protein